MNREDIISYCEERYPDDEILLADGFEDAFMGIAESFGSAPKALYNTEECIDTLTVRDGMSYDEAIEFFNFNIAGAYVGEHTPAFVEPLYCIDTPNTSKKLIP